MNPKITKFLKSSRRTFAFFKSFGKHLPIFPNILTFKVIKKNDYGDYPDDETEDKFYAVLAYHAFKSNISIKKGRIISDLDS